MLVIVVFVGSFFWSPSKSVHQSIKQPSSVTLQVLNGCGDSGAAQKLADALLPGDSTQVYDIIEKGDAPMSAFEKTTVVDRRGPSNGGSKISPEARGVANRLGISEKDVVVLRLEENLLNIDVTVIAGKDYGVYVTKLKGTKEASL